MRKGIWIASDDLITSFNARSQARGNPDPVFLRHNKTSDWTKEEREARWKGKLTKQEETTS